MSKWANDSVLDAGLDKIATGLSLSVCTQQPTNKTEAITTYKLATVAIDSGDFTKSDGVVNGRKVTISSQDQLTVDTTGNATHLAICDGTDLLAVTTCTPQILTQGNTVTIPSWNIGFADPS
jgi:hypothetical protein